MKIFVCPSLTGRYVIGAENINEAKKVMEEYIEGYGSGITFYVDKIRRDMEMEEIFNGIHKMMKLE